MSDAVKCIAAGYYEGWASNPTPTEIDYSKFDVIFFGAYADLVHKCASLNPVPSAFAVPSSSYGLSWDSDGPPKLKELVNGARDSGTKVVLSVGK